jgi:hypothetical protein
VTVRWRAGGGTVTARELLVFFDDGPSRTRRFQAATD